MDLMSFNLTAFARVPAAYGNSGNRRMGGYRQEAEVSRTLAPRFPLGRDYHTTRSRDGGVHSRSSSSGSPGIWRSQCRRCFVAFAVSGILNDYSYDAGLFSTVGRQGSVSIRDVVDGQTGQRCRAHWAHRSGDHWWSFRTGQARLGGARRWDGSAERHLGRVLQR